MSAPRPTRRRVIERQIAYWRRRVEALGDRHASPITARRRSDALQNLDLFEDLLAQVESGKWFEPTEGRWVPVNPITGESVTDRTEGESR